VQLTVLSHAGLLVEHQGVRIVSDPWLFGSCYWRSWWNLPEPPAGLVDELETDYIYLTHLHWDHFHGPSLRRLLKPHVRVLVPKVPTRRMLDDLDYLGFKNITEIPHGTSFQLADDFRLWSYQFGPAVDSAMVLRGGGRTLLNANDCKHFGLPLKQITRRFPRFDFVFRSHSSASPIPYCVEGYTETLAGLRSQHDYIEEFSRFALHVRARYAVPFASNHCFLHRDTYRFNSTAVSPEDVRMHYRQLVRDSALESECVVMAPGSSWSESDGFRIETFDYSQRMAYIDGLRVKHAGALAKQYEKEADARVDEAAADRYFTAFLAAIPRFLGRWLKYRLVFRVTDAAGEHCWLLDLRHGVASRVATADIDCAVIDIPTVVFNDCVSNRMFSTWSASKRLVIRLRSADQLGLATGMFTLFDLYELDMLPLRRNVSARALSVRLRRWRDVIEALNLVLRHRVLGQRFDVASLYELPAPNESR
jgi:UDP-MurNAc hydroxylase